MPVLLLALLENKLSNFPLKDLYGINTDPSLCSILSLQDHCARYWEASRQCQLPKCLQCVVQVGSSLCGKAFDFIYLSSSTRGPMRNKKEVQNSRSPRSDKVFPYWIPITASFLHCLNFQFSGNCCATLPKRSSSKHSGKIQN